MENHPHSPSDDRRHAASGTPQIDDSLPARSPIHPPLIRIALLLYAALLAVVALCWLWSGESPIFLSAQARFRGVDPVPDIGAGVLAAVATLVISDQWTRRGRPGEPLARALAALVGRLSVFECLILAVASGVAEEAFFRGVLQPRLGLVGASLIFGLVHLVPRRELLPWAGFAVAAGFALGGLFVATGNLVAPAVAHVLINAVNLRLLGSRYGSAR